MVLGDGESHELFQRHAIFGIDLEQARRNGGETQALFDDVDAQEEGRGDGLLGHALVAHGLKCAELVERVQRCTLDVFDQRHLVDQYATGGVADDAGHRRGSGQTLLLGEQFQRAIAAPAGWHLEHAGFRALGVEDGPDMQGLDQAASGDGFGEFLDRDAGLHPPDVRLAQDQLVEGDVVRGRQGDFLKGSSHR